MVVGIGIDIVEVARVKDAVERWGDRFLRRVFTDGEVAYCMSKKNPYPHLAARFAAKEAAVKAFSEAGDFLEREGDPVAGTDRAGRRPAICVHARDIEVVNKLSGRPFLRCPRMLSFGSSHRNGLVARVSLTHEKKYAVAAVVLEIVQENQIKS